MKRGKSRKSFGKTEGDLLQSRVKSINSLLDNNSKQRDIYRSKLASMVLVITMQQCQELIDKVREFKYSKVKGKLIN